LAVRQNTSYYQQRAREDAQYEQQFRAGSKKKELEGTKSMKNLKSQDRRSSGYI
jgi:hypothetical protein